MSVGVEDIYAVVLGSNKQHIVPTLAGYVQSCEKERLGIDVSVYFQREYLSKMADVHIVRSQGGFESVGAAARVVILRRSHTLRAHGESHGQNQDQHKWLCQRLGNIHQNWVPLFLPSELRSAIRAEARSSDRRELPSSPESKQRREQLR